MNTKNNLLVFIILLMLSSCKQNSRDEIKYVYLKGDIISDSIYSRMPGNFFSTNQHLIWVDPFNFKDYIHFIDLNTHNEIATIGTIGQGPNEFSTPAFSLTYNNRLFIYDLNEKKQAIVDMDSATVGKEKYIFLNDNNKKSILTNKLMIDEYKYIELNPESKEHMFSYINKNHIYIFGKPFINDNFNNYYDIYQGEIAYNIDRNKFVYTNLSFPYLAIFDYDNKNDAFFLASEIKEEFDYKISDFELKRNETKKGCMGLALSKNYIILHKRDYKTNNIKENELDFSQFDQLPQTVFLYDYNGTLKYIVNLDIPTLRISANIKNNNLYIIGVNPEFVIMKYDLDNLPSNLDAI